MADGRELAVPHRDFLARSPTGRTVLIDQQDDEFRVLDLLLMTEIRMLPANPFAA